MFGFNKNYSCQNPSLHTTVLHKSMTIREPCLWPRKTFYFLYVTHEKYVPTFGWFLRIIRVKRGYFSTHTDQNLKIGITPNVQRITISNSRRHCTRCQDVNDGKWITKTCPKSLGPTTRPGNKPKPKSTITKSLQSITSRVYRRIIPFLSLLNWRGLVDSNDDLLLTVKNSELTFRVVNDHLVIGIFATKTCGHDFFYKKKKKNSHFSRTWILSCYTSYPPSYVLLYHREYLPCTRCPLRMKYMGNVISKSLLLFGPWTYFRLETKHVTPGRSVYHFHLQKRESFFNQGTTGSFRIEKVGIEILSHSWIYPFLLHLCFLTSCCWCRNTWHPSPQPVRTSWGRLPPVGRTVTFCMNLPLVPYTKVYFFLDYNFE